jgi:hypothetical protein
MNMPEQEAKQASDKALIVHAKKLTMKNFILPLPSKSKT